MKRLRFCAAKAKKPGTEELHSKQMYSKNIVDKTWENSVLTSKSLNIQNYPQQSLGTQVV